MAEVLRHGHAQYARLGDVRKRVGMAQLRQGRYAQTGQHGDHQATTGKLLEGVDVKHREFP
jgi:hypothetical protein